MFLSFIRKSMNVESATDRRHEVILVPFEWVVLAVGDNIFCLTLEGVQRYKRSR